MLQLKDFMPVNFLKKEKYTAAAKGMRFRMKSLKKKERKLLSSESASGRNRTALTARQRKKSNFRVYL